jgi:hypothetical protein
MLVLISHHTKQKSYCLPHPGTIRAIPARGLSRPQQRACPLCRWEVGLDRLKSWTLLRTEMSARRERPAGRGSTTFSAASPIQFRSRAVSIGQMDTKSNALTRLVLFGLIACSLIWLGTHRPKVAATGPGLVVVSQGSNVSFQLQNAQSHFLVVGSASAFTNRVPGATNETSK